MANEDRDKQRDDLHTLRNNVESLRMSTEQIIELNAINSKILYARWLSLIAVGFTEVQAFEIIKARGLLA